MALQFIELARCATTIIGHQLKVCATLRATQTSGNHFKSYSPFPPLRNFNSSSSHTGVQRPGGNVPVDQSTQKIPLKQGHQPRLLLRVLGSRSDAIASSARFKQQNFENRVDAHSYPRHGKQRPGVPKFKDTERGDNGRFKSVSASSLPRYREKQDGIPETDDVRSKTKSKWPKKDKMNMNYLIDSDLSKRAIVNKIQSENAESGGRSKAKDKTKNRLEEEMEEKEGDGFIHKSSKWKTSVKDCHHRGNSNVPVSNLAREMSDWLLAVREHMIKLEKEGKKKIRQSSKFVSEEETSKNDRNVLQVSGSLAQRLFNTINPLPEKPVSVDPNVRMRTTPQSDSKSLPSSKTDQYFLDDDRAMNRNLEKINDELSRFRKEKNSERDSTRPLKEKTVEKNPDDGDTEELLEIRPSYVENIEGHTNKPIPIKEGPDKIARNYASNQRALSKTVGDCSSSENVQISKSVRGYSRYKPQIERKRVKENNMSDAEIDSSVQEKGFILVNEQRSRFTSPSSVSYYAQDSPKHNNFIFLDEENEDKPVRESSSQEKKNILLENDNPHFKYGVEKLMPEEPVQEFISHENLSSHLNKNVSSPFLDDGIFGSIASNERDRQRDNQSQTMMREKRGSSREKDSEQDTDTLEAVKCRPVSYWNPSESHKESWSTSNWKEDTQSWVRTIDEKLKELKHKQAKALRKNNEKKKKSVKESPATMKRAESVTNTILSSIKNTSKIPLESSFTGLKRRNTTVANDNQENLIGGVSTPRKYIKPIANKLKRSMDIIKTANADYSRHESTLVHPLDSGLSPKRFMNQTMRNTTEKDSSLKVPVTDGKSKGKTKRNPKETGSVTSSFKKDTAEPKEVTKKRGKQKSTKRSASFPAGQNFASTNVMKMRIGAGSKKSSKDKAESSDMPDIGDHEIWSQRLLNKMAEYQKFATMEVSESNVSPATKGSKTKASNRLGEESLQSACIAKVTKPPSKIFPKGKPFTMRSKELTSDSGFDGRSGKSHRKTLERYVKKQEGFLPKSLDLANPSASASKLNHTANKSNEKQSQKLVDELRKQWSKSFKEKYLNMQQDRLLNSIKDSRGKESSETELEKKLKSSQSNNRSGGISSAPESSDYSKWLDDHQFREAKSAPNRTQVSEDSTNLPRAGGKKKTRVSKKADKDKAEKDSQVKDPFEGWLQSRDHEINKFFEANQFEGLNCNSNKMISRPSNDEKSPVEKQISFTPFNSEVKDSTLLFKSDKTPDRTSAASVVKKQQAKSDQAIKTQGKSQKLESNIKKQNIAPLIYKDIRETYLRAALKKHNQSLDNDGSGTPPSEKSTNATGLSHDSKKPKIDFSDGHQANVNAIYNNIMQADSILSQLQRASANIPESDLQTPKKLKTTSRTSFDKSYPPMPEDFIGAFDGVMSMTVTEEPVIPSSPPKSKMRKGSSKGSGEGRCMWFRDDSNDLITKGTRKNDWLDYDTPLLDMSKHRLDSAEEFTKRRYPEKDLRESLADQRQQSVLDARNDLIKSYQKNIQKYEAALNKYRAKLRNAQEAGNLLLKTRSSMQEKTTKC